MDAEKQMGGCLCGAVRYTLTETSLSGGHCYCEACRRSGGSDHRSHATLPDGAISIQGALTYYERTADSGSKIRMGFCPRCGSPILSHNSSIPGMTFLSVSSLDDPEIFTPAMVVFTKREPFWAVRDKDLPSFEAMPPSEAMRKAV